jgi:hypothetical protein
MHRPLLPQAILAHDICHQLGTISLNLQLLADERKLRLRDREHIRRVVLDIQRSASLLHHIMEVASEMGARSSVSAD